MSLLSCPNEVLYDIFLRDCISIRDLCNLMLCCHRFLDVIRTSNDLWRRKFKQRWPQLTKFEGLDKDTVWLEMTCLRSSIGKEVERTLNGLSEKSYPIGQPPLHLLDVLINKDSPVPDFIENHLLEIVFHPQDINENLTTRYYARQVIRYLRSNKLQKCWQDLMKLPESQKSLLAGAVLISQWGQMEQEHLPCFSEVDQIIENISQRVMYLVGDKKNVFEGRTEDPRYIKLILNYINQVLYGEIGLKGNQEDYYNPENSYIEKVLQNKKGIPITLCIIYHEVAKKLGILCEPVSFPQHFLLRWREHPQNDVADSFTYIDAFNCGASHQPRSCPALIGQPRQHIRREAYATVPAEQVFLRMVNNLIQCSRVHEGSRLEENRLQNQLHFPRLACAVSPGQTPSVVAYAELCVFLGVQLGEAINLLQAEGYTDDTMIDFEPGHWSRVRQITLTKCTRKLAEQQEQISKIVECRRLPSVKFAVGLVMLHTFTDLGGLMIRRCKCVIVSWDPDCQASTEWVTRSGVLNLTRGVNQPFYHVLTNDGSFRYVAEDTLTILPPGTPINHPDIGLHFERFDGRRYVPNREKKAHYPDDEAFALSLM